MQVLLVCQDEHRDALEIICAGDIGEAIPHGFHALAVIAINDKDYSVALGIVFLPDAMERFVSAQVPKSDGCPVK